MSPHCMRCGRFGHMTDDCTVNLDAPVEVPGHNGEYRGRARVQVIAPGVTGEDVRAQRSHLRRSRKKAAERTRLLRAEMSSSPAYQLAESERKRKRDMASRERRRSRRLKPRAKWER